MAKAQTTSENPQGEVSQQDTPVLPMQYDVRIHSIQFDGPCRATASLNINGCFAVRGVKLMEGSNGLFVSIRVKSRTSVFRTHGRHAPNWNRLS